MISVDGRGDAREQRVRPKGAELPPPVCVSRAMHGTAARAPRSGAVSAFRGCIARAISTNQNLCETVLVGFTFVRPGFWSVLDAILACRQAKNNACPGDGKTRVDDKFEAVLRS